MDQRFCTHCGAQLVSGARFCVECGERADGIARKPARRVAADRLAPAIVVAVVLAVAAGAIFVASRSAAPPAVVPPRESAPAANAAAPLPDGHPPLTVPDDVRQVIERMTELARSKPDDLETWKQLGFVQYRAGQVDRTYLAAAATTYEHVLEIDPKNLDALRALGNIAFDGEKADRAIDYYQRFLAIQPGDTGVLTDLGTMYLSAQQTEKAIETYQTVLKADPKFFQAQFNLAIAYRAAGDSDKALDALKQARGVAEDDATRQRVERPARPTDRRQARGGGTGAAGRHRRQGGLRVDLPRPSDRRAEARSHRVDDRALPARRDARLSHGRDAARGAQALQRSHRHRPARQEGPAPDR